MNSEFRHSGAGRNPAERYSPAKRTTRFVASRWFCSLDSGLRRNDGAVIMNTLPPAIFLMGPTASGKTGVAVELVQRLPVELISVDSALVFRDMDIGTAKPDAATLARAPHHLIDIIDPDRGLFRCRLSP